MKVAASYQKGAHSKMFLPADAIANARCRSSVADGRINLPDYKETGFQWCLATIDLHAVSDERRFLNELELQIKKYDGHVPADSIVEGEQPSQYLIFMYGDFDYCEETLGKIFGNPWTEVPCAFSPGLYLDVNIGLCQYRKGMQPEHMVKKAKEKGIELLVFSGVSSEAEETYDNAA